jgi:hypothetical protein
VRFFSKSTYSSENPDVSDRYLVVGGLSGVDSALEILEFDQTGAHAAEICISVKLSDDHDEMPNV